MRRIVEYTIVDHGVESASYFGGEGIAMSHWHGVATGAGENAKEAYEDAVEQLAQSDWDVDALPKRPRGISTKSKVRRDYRNDEEWDDDIHYYVSVKVRGDANVDGNAVSRSGASHGLARRHMTDAERRRLDAREQVERDLAAFNRRARERNRERGIR